MHRYLHVMLLILFVVSMQGCSSTEKTEEAFVLETPQIESITPSAESNVSEIVVHGKAGAAVYVNGKHVATINQEGTAVIALEMPQDEAPSVATLVLKDDAGNESEPVVFTLTHENSQTPDVNSSEEDNNSTDNGDGNVSVDDDNDSVIIPPTVVTLKSLKLTADKTTLNKDTNTTVNVTATFSDNSTKDVTKQVKWIITPTNALNITNQNLKTLQDGNITIQAKFDSTTSNVLHVNVFWEVNGYRLPPMPNEAVNNSTLLGIDTNNNDVRDDVERWIYETYKDKHPIHIDIAMQAGRAYKKVLETPERAKEIHDVVSAPSYCESYYKIYAKYFNKDILVNKDITNEYFRSRIIFNTLERERAYLEYDELLSGDSYTTPKIGEGKKLCDFNISKYE